MVLHRFTKTLSLPRPACEVFAWHELPDSLPKLIPPESPVRVVEHVPGKISPISDGARVVLQLGYPPLAMHWVAIHEGYQPGRQFIDVQKSGPFAFWRHTHRFLEVGDSASTLEDQVEYALPLGWLGDRLAHAVVRFQIERMFRWRHTVTRKELSPEAS